jgi:ubiquinone/menaquinone biosynthesis C-methylase UbiE
MCAVEMEFTGERVVPGKTPADIYKEHIDRYVFAAGIVSGLEVLDVACGTGYGARCMLQRGARRVTGVDLSLEAVGYARERFGGDGGGRFVCGDAVSLPFPDRSFDAVVSFETLEHIRAYGRFLAECRRVLADGGVIVCSTPNRRVFSPNLPRPLNPFHVKEFWPEEFRRLMSRHFGDVVLHGQCDVTLRDNTVDRQSGVGAFRDDGEVSSGYMIGVARRGRRSRA